MATVGMFGVNARASSREREKKMTEKIHKGKNILIDAAASWNDAFVDETAGPLEGIAFPGAAAVRRRM